MREVGVSSGIWCKVAAVMVVFLESGPYCD